MKIKATVQIDMDIDDEFFELRSDVTKEKFVDNFKREIVDEVRKSILDEETDGVKLIVTCEARIVD